MNLFEFKLLGIKVLKFIIILIFVDFVLGTLAGYLFNTQQTGKYHRSNHVINQTEAELLVFGSSHAIRHYDPRVIEKSLGLSCYNAGADGQQLVYQLALQKMVLKRYQPKIILLNIDPSWLYTSNVAYNRLSDLYPYYDSHSEIMNSILDKRDRFLQLKMIFKSYQSNSTLVHILKYYVIPQPSINGFRPLSGKMDADKFTAKHIELENKNETSKIIDENFIEMLQQFIENAKKNKIELYLISSPSLNQSDHTNALKIINQIASSNKVPYLDFLNNKTYTSNYSLFHDKTHLNEEGAVLFTTDVLKWIKKNSLIE